MKAAVCSRCQEPLTTDTWHPSAAKRRWLICKECERKRQRAYDKNNPDKVYNRNRAKRYGIDFEEYQRLLKEQNFKCGICNGVETHSSKKNLSVDHCHTTGKVRGLLCSECNVGLGKFKDDADLLNKALEYLNAM